MGAGVEGEGFNFDDLKVCGYCFTDYLCSRNAQKPSSPPPTAPHVPPGGQADGQRRRVIIPLVWHLRGHRRGHCCGRGLRRYRRGLRLPHDRRRRHVCRGGQADGPAADNFGYSVAIDGATIVVGGYEDQGQTGAVYVFRTTDGWSTYTEIELTASDGASPDVFGISVAIDGGTIVIGARGADDAELSGNNRARPTSSARPTVGPRTSRWPS